MTQHKVALFVTCLVDMMRPRIGFAAIRALEAAGCDVVVPEGQTCCGQPALNSGDTDHAIALAKQTIVALEPYEAVVVPSGLLQHDGFSWQVRGGSFVHLREVSRQGRRNDAAAACSLHRQPQAIRPD